VRRVEAVTAAPALAHIGQTDAALREAAGVLRVAPLEVPKRLQKLLEDQKALEKRIAGLETRLAVARAEALAATARTINEVPVVAARVDGLDSEGLRAVVDAIRDRLGSGVVVVGGAADGKVSLVAAVTRDLTKRYHAGKLIQTVAQVVGGGGGGRPDLAQAGGKDPARLDEALALVHELIAGR
jgi:alanyl-tRNA synthetase